MLPAYIKRGDCYIWSARALVCDIRTRSSFIMNITFVLCSKRSKKSKRRTFAFKVRSLLFLAYREGTLTLYRACLSCLYIRCVLILITNLLTIVLRFEARFCWFLTYKNITFRHKHKTWSMHAVVFGLFWFTEEGKLHLECAFLGFCACVGISFIERGMCGFALVLVYGL